MPDSVNNLTPENPAPENTGSLFGSITDFWNSFTPQTKNMLLGAGLGSLFTYGLSNPQQRSLMSLLLGALLGGAAGYYYNDIASLVGSMLGSKNPKTPTSSTLPISSSAAKSPKTTAQPKIITEVPEPPVARNPRPRNAFNDIGYNITRENYIGDNDFDLY